MRMRNLINLSVILLFSSAAAFAQSTPPAPAEPPETPEAPMSFAFAFDGGNYLGVVPEEINRENMSRYGLGAVRGGGPVLCGGGTERPVPEARTHGPGADGSRTDGERGVPHLAGQR